MEGQLNKFTNLVKGWQFRWFVLDPEKGTLSYYLVCMYLEFNTSIKSLLVLFNRKIFLKCFKHG